MAFVPPGVAHAMGQAGVQRLVELAAGLGSLGGAPEERFGVLMIPCTGGSSLRFEVREPADREGYTYGILGPAAAELRPFIGGGCGSSKESIYITGVFNESDYTVTPSSWRVATIGDGMVVVPKEETGRDEDLILSTFQAQSAREDVERGSTWTPAPAEEGIFLCRLPNGQVETIPQGIERTEKLRQYGYTPDAFGSDCDEAMRVYRAILASEASGVRPEDVGAAAEPEDLAPWSQGLPGDRTGGDPAGGWRADPLPAPLVDLRGTGQGTGTRPPGGGIEGHTLLLIGAAAVGAALFLQGRR